MRPSIWRYKLASASGPPHKREGALLRFEFEPDQFGYSDCHPWQELGDLPLEQQLQWRPIGTSLMAETVHFAFLDHAARVKGQSLLKELEIPASHASMPDALSNLDESISEFGRLRKDGFREVKIKAREGLTEATGAILVLATALQKIGMKMRLDLNACSGKAEVANFLSAARSCAETLDWLDWIEDPCPFDNDSWRSLKHEFNVRLALDFAADPLAVHLEDSADVIILKPAVQRYQDVLKRAADLNLPVCVTSYLDHPVGQCFAARVAAIAANQGAKLETCGLITHTVYQPNAFSERLSTDGPRLIPPAGTGIGFDDLLEKLPWEALN